MVERGGLENRCATCRTEGSNPSLSATRTKENLTCWHPLKGKACPLRGQALLVPDCLERTINNRLQPESVTHTHPETGLVIDIFV